MTKRFRSSLSPASEVERVPRLDREFRRPPPPHQYKRRKPSRGHLLQGLAPADSATAMDTAPTAAAAAGPSGNAVWIVLASLCCVCVCVCVVLCSCVCTVDPQLRKPSKIGTSSLQGTLVSHYFSVLFYLEIL